VPSASPSRALGLLDPLSFKHWMLLSFGLIGVLLGGTSVWSLVTVDRLLAQSQKRAYQSIEMNAAAQALGARSLDMERAARQSLILSDPALLGQFQDMASEAWRLLTLLESLGLPAEAAQAWQGHLGLVRDQLDDARSDPLAREQEVALQFQAIRLESARIGRLVQETVAQQTEALEQAFARKRQHLAQLVGLALLLALLMALTLGRWLTRPLRQLEQSITALGENRLDAPIELSGPQDLRRLGQQLSWLRDRLTELDADKARFLRHVSHELKTPLAAVHEGVAVLKDRVAGPLSNDQVEVVAILERHTMALQQQIETLLRFNAAAFEARRLLRTRCDLRALLQEVIDQQRLQWQAHSLYIRLEGGPMWIHIDRDKMASAFANLLSNAIRFSPPGGEVRIVLSQAPGEAVVDIADQGPGIEQADKARIFEPFYRGRRQPEHHLPGTGVGLSIVQEYVVAHGGTVRLLDTGTGAQVQLRLPRTEG
jgi:two-component system, NtrC family, sensor histidine kinase GlrK